MNTITINVQSDREVSFVGEELSRFEFSFVWDEQVKYQLHGAVFAVEGGGFATEIWLTSDAPNPSISAHEFELIDNFEEVDKFFYVFDLFENFCDHALGRREQEECGKRVSKLEKSYHAVLFPFLEGVKTQVVGSGLCDRLKSEKPKSKFWNLFPSST